MKKIVRCENYYTFDSVEELKEKVDTDRYLEDNNYFIPEDIFWAEYIEEDFKQICKLFGIENVETCWDVSYSQGSGASFTGKCYPEDRNIKVLKEYAPQDKELISLYNYFKEILDIGIEDCDENDEECMEYNKITYIKITRCRNTYYCHSNTMCTEAYTEEGIVYNNYITNRLNDIFMGLADWLFDRLQTEYEYITSEEYLLNYIVDSEIKIPEEYLKDNK